MAAQGHPANEIQEAPRVEASELSDKIAAALLKAQQRDLRRDDGNGSRSARQIALAVGMETAACRALLRAMAADGLVRFHACLNGHFWSSINPLPWEPGGAIWAEKERLAAAWRQPLTVVVQSVSHDRVGKVYRDVKAYPAELLSVAEAHVRMENAQSEARTRNDQISGAHLRATYSPWPTYRLVFLYRDEPAVLHARASLSSGDR